MEGSGDQAVYNNPLSSILLPSTCVTYKNDTVPLFVDCEAPCLVLDEKTGKDIEEYVSECNPNEEENSLVEYAKISCEHEKIVRHKQELEVTTQKTHASLWKVQHEIQELHGRCQCGSPVLYELSFDVAHFNHFLFQQLCDDFYSLHHQNCDTLFFSLVQLKQAELKAKQFLHSKIEPFYCTKDNGNRFVKFCEIADSLFSLLLLPLPSSSSLFVRDLLFYVVSEYLRSIESTDGEGMAFTMREEVSSYLITKLMEVNGLSWGMKLIKGIPISLVVGEDILNYFAREGICASENDINLFLCSIIWDCKVRVSEEQVELAILSPLLQLLNAAASASYISTIHLLGKIIICLSYQYESIGGRMMSQLCRANWPTKLVCSNLLCNAPIYILNDENIISMISSLYNLHETTFEEFARETENFRQKHRMDFVRYVFQFLVPKKLRHPGRPSYQPILRIFYELTGKCISHLLRSSLLEEFYFFAFSPSILVLHEDSQIAQQWQQEARTFYRLLIRAFPALLSSFLHSIMLHSDISWNVVMCVLQEPFLFSHFVADAKFFRFLLFCLSGRSFPDSESLEDPKIVLLWIKHLKEAKEKSSEPNSQEMLGKVAAFLFPLIPWHLVPSHLKLYPLVLSIFCGRQIRLHENGWKMAAILRSEEELNSLCALNLDSLLEPSGIAYVNFITIKLLCILRVVSELESEEERTSTLLRFSFFDLLQQVEPYSKEFSLVISHTECLQSTNSCILKLRKLLSFSFSQRPHLSQFIITLQMALFTSWGETFQAKREKRAISFWFALFLPTSFEDRCNSILLNDFIAFLVASGEPFQNLKIRDLLWNTSEPPELNKTFPWISFIQMIEYEANQRTIKVKSEFSLEQSALALQDSPVAIAFWMHYFSSLYRSISSSAILSKEKEIFLSSHFLRMASTWSHRTPAATDQELTHFQAVYIAFSSFHQKTIESCLGDLSCPSFDSNMIHAIKEQLPDRFQIVCPPQNNETQTKTPLPFQPSCNSSSFSQIIATIPKWKETIQQTEEIANSIRKVNLEVNNVISLFFDLETSTTSFPIIEKLLSSIQKYSTLSLELERLDDDFLGFSKEMRSNTPYPFHMQLYCDAGPSICRGAAIISGTRMQTEILQEKVANLQENRLLYANYFQEFFLHTNEVAHLLTVIEIAMKKKIIQDFPPDLSCALLASFFTFLPLFIHQNTIYDQLVSIILELGDLTCRGFAEQTFLFRELFGLSPAIFDASPQLILLLKRDILFGSGERMILMNLLEIMKEKGKIGSGPVFSLILSLFPFKEVIESTVLVDDIISILEIVPIGLGKSCKEFSLSSSPFPLLVSSALLHTNQDIMTASCKFLVSKSMLQVEPEQFASFLELLKEFSFQNALLSQCIFTCATLGLPLLPECLVSHMISIVRIFSSRNSFFMAHFLSEHSTTSYTASGELIIPPLWNRICSFIQTGMNREEGVKLEMLKFLFEIISSSRLSTVLDNLWLFLSSVVLPVVSSECDELYFVPFCLKLPWNASQFLLHDMQAISRMVDLFQEHSMFVSYLFMALDWFSFFSLLRSLSRPPTTDAASALGMAYLKLFILVEVAGICPMEEEQRKYAFEQMCEVSSCFNSSKFASLCDGNMIRSILASGKVREDPTEKILEICFCLRHIASTIDKPLAALAVVREISSLLYFSLKLEQQGRKPSFWYLSLLGHTSLLTGALIPLVMQYTIDTSRESVELALMLVSCMYVTEWALPVSISCHSSLALFSSYPTQFPNQKGDVQCLFVEKMKGLVLQCCGTASAPLALQIIRALPLPDVEVSDGDVLSPVSWVDVMEILLRSYYVNVEDSNVFASPCSCLSLSIPDRPTLMDISINKGSSFTLLTLLHQWKRESFEMGTSWPTALFHIALRFSPLRYRMFDYVLFWFFCLEIVEGDSFDPVENQNESFVFLEHLRGISGLGEECEASVVLAAKVTEIFFYRFIRHMRGERASSKADSVLHSLMKDFMASRSLERFSVFDSFWKQVGSVLEPSFSLLDLKMLILSTLIPNAQPIIGKIVFSEVSASLIL